MNSLFKTRGNISFLSKKFNIKQKKRSLVLKSSPILENLIEVQEVILIYNIKR